MSALRHIVKRGFESLEGLFDRAFGSQWNPFHQLGSLGWFFFWIVVFSGVYLYIFFDSGISQAYRSVEYLTHVQWYAGGVMRSFHRYASDALVVVVMLHLLREFGIGRYRGPRWFAWFTGIPLIWLIFAAGITGYWVVWDVLAQYIAIASTEWLDSLPLFGEPIARNFLHSTTLSGRFFTLMVFIHIGAPLVLLFLMWVHIQRHNHPRVNPPRGLAIGTLAMLFALSAVFPAQSHPPADLATVPAMINLDWFYLALYPLLDRYSGLAVWGLVSSATVLLLVLPWLSSKPKIPVAVVDLENCNGCTRCFIDCPFSAIRMAPRTDGQSAYEQEAVVDTDRCVGCGICVGACPTATPFRRRTELSPGIDLATQPIAKVRDEALAIGEGLSGEGRVLVFGCEHGPALDTLTAPGVGTVTLSCIGMLPPSFIDFALARTGVDGVMLTGCQSGDCFHRLGIGWTEARIACERDPYLRARVPREHIATCWAGAAGLPRLQSELGAFRARLVEAKTPDSEPPAAEVKRRA